MMSEEGSLKEGTGGVTGSFKEDDSQWQDENESNMSEADTRMNEAMNLSPHGNIPMYGVQDILAAFMDESDTQPYQPFIPIQQPTDLHQPYHPHPDLDVSDNSEDEDEDLDKLIHKLDDDDSIHKTDDNYQASDEEYEENLEGYEDGDAIDDG